MKKAIQALALAVPALFLGACSSCPLSEDSSAEVVVCDDCGVEKGTDGCCDPNAERCGDCGKIKGSEGCCE